MSKDFDNMMIREIEKKLHDVDIWSMLPTLVQHLRQQRRENELIRSLLESGKFYDCDVDGRLRWHHELGDWKRDVITEELHERNRFYERLRAKALKDYGTILSDFQELKARLDEVVAKQEAEEFAKLEAKHREFREALRPTDWGAIDRKHAEVREGFVYVLTNASMPGLIKLGFTTQSPPKRAEQLSRETPVPTPFNVACYWRVKDPYVLEQMLGADLKESNAGKEFYRLTPEHVSELVQEKYSEFLLPADTLIAETPNLRRARAAGIEIGAHPDDGKPVTLHSGRYGPYVKHGSTVASLPKGESEQELSFERALQLLAAKAERNRQIAAKAEKDDN